MTLLDERDVAPTATTFPQVRSALRTDETAQWFAMREPMDQTRKVHFAVIERSQGTQVAPWVKYLSAQLNSLLELREGWDGHRAKPVTETAVRALVAVLAVVMNREDLFPAVFPLPDGGLQAEWHAAGRDIEIEVEGDGGTFVFVRDPSGGVTTESDVAIVDLESASPTIHDESSLLALKAVSYAVHQLTVQVREAHFRQ